MAQYDSFDICEAYKVLEIEWNSGGWLQERPSNQRRREATHIQLARMGFNAPSVWNYKDLSDNGKEIYQELCARYGFKPQGQERNLVYNYADVFQ